MSIQELLGLLSSVYPFLLAGLNIITCWAVLWLRSHFTSKERTDALEARLGVLEKGHADINTRLKSLPTQEHIHNLNLAIKEIQGTQNTLNAQMEGVANLVNRLEAQTRLITQSLL